MPKSKSDVHETPDIVYDMITANFGYTKDEMFDPCPVDWAKSGLEIVWGKINYVNPPYSLLKEFVAEAIYQHRLFNKKTVMLLPSKTDQQWFHDLLHGKYKIIWIRRRLKFKNNKWSATQPHFLVLIK